MSKRWNPPAIARTSAFAAGAILLLTFARSGQSVLTIQIMFAVFVITATLWVRGQYAETLGRNRTQWLIPLPWALGVLAVAALLILSYRIWHRAGAALTGVLLAYFIAGSAVVWLRQVVRGGRPGRDRGAVLGAALTAAGGVAAAAGIVLFGVGGLGTAGITAVYVLLAVAFLALLPVGVSLLSEWGIRRVAATTGTLPGWAGLAGALVFAGLAALLYRQTGSFWLLAAVAVLALLVVALVSRTQADVAMILAAIALGGVTPLPADPPPALRPDGNNRPALVAFGDSYMAGEGAAIYYDGTDEGGGNQCRRSPTAWAAMAGQQRPFGRVAFLACSGARTRHLMMAGEPQRGEADTQLDAYVKNYAGVTPGLVVVGVGGNDAGFSAVGAMCLAPGNCDRKSALWTGALDQVRVALGRAYSQIHRVFRDTAPVVVIPYPDPVKVDGRCADVAIARSEKRWLHEFVTGGLNRVVKEAAGEYGFYYLAEMERSLADAHLQLCDEANQGRPGLNFIGLRSVRGVAEQRFNPMNWWHSSLHPNERGHAALLSTFEGWLAAHETDLRPPGEVRAVVAAGGPPAGVAPQCDVLDSTPAGCRREGMDWAKAQVRAALLTRAWPVLLALAGVWCAAVAFFGLRYRSASRAAEP